MAFWMMHWNSLLPVAKPADDKQERAVLQRNLREHGRMDALRTMLSLSKADTAAILPRSRRSSFLYIGEARQSVRSAS